MLPCQVLMKENEHFFGILMEVSKIEGRSFKVNFRINKVDILYIIAK